ncbi:MAG: 50S ribosomal protein L31 [Aggregatilineales bacterium]
MKAEIHPEWFEDATITCVSCGTAWQTGATKAALQTEICSNCHPFYTGEQRIVDTEGRVEKFMSRLKRREDMQAQRDAEEAAKTPMDLPLSELGLSRRHLTVLEQNEIIVVADVLDELTESGEQGLLDISGIGRQAVSEIKRRLTERGYTLPEAPEVSEDDAEEVEAAEAVEAATDDSDAGDDSDA